MQWRGRKPTRHLSIPSVTQNTPIAASSMPWSGVEKENFVRGEKLCRDSIHWLINTTINQRITHHSQFECFETLQQHPQSGRIHTQCALHKNGRVHPPQCQQFQPRARWDGNSSYILYIDEMGRMWRRRLCIEFERTRESW